MSPVRKPLSSGGATVLWLQLFQNLFNKGKLSLSIISNPKVVYGRNNA